MLHLVEEHDALMKRLAETQLKLDLFWTVFFGRHFLGIVCLFLQRSTKMISWVFVLPEHTLEYS